MLGGGIERRRAEEPKEMLPPRPARVTLGGVGGVGGGRGVAVGVPAGRKRGGQRLETLDFRRWRAAIVAQGGRLANDGSAPSFLRPCH